MRNVMLAMGLATAFAAAPAMAGVVYGPLDFEAETVGTFPAHPAPWSSSDAVDGITIAVTGPTAQTIGTSPDTFALPATPAGMTGNALMLDDGTDVTGSSSSYIYYSTGAAGAVTGEGTLTAKVYSLAPDADHNSGYGLLRLYNGTGTIAVTLSFDAGAKTVTLSGKTLTNKWTGNAVHDVMLHFDTSTSKVSGTIDGAPMTDGTTTSFSFTNSVPSVNYLYAGAGYSTVTARMIVDDLTLSSGPPVPEPATLSLLGLGGLVMFLRRRHG